MKELKQMKELNHYIEQQKRIEPSPFLKEKILNSVYASQETMKAESNRRLTVWQSFAIAASIVVIISLGITLGRSYQPEQQIPINDNYIENFELFVTDINSSPIDINNQ